MDTRRFKIAGLIVLSLILMVTISACDTASDTTPEPETFEANVTIEGLDSEGHVDAFTLADADGAYNLDDFNHADGTLSGEIADLEDTVELTLTVDNDEVADGEYTPSTQTAEVTADETDADFTVDLVVKAKNQPPIILISSTSGLKATIKGVITDVDGSISKVTIDWKDDNITTLNSGFDNINETHNYNNEGTYDVIIKAIDNDGGTTSYILSLTVKDSHEQSRVSHLPNFENAALDDLNYKLHAQRSMPEKGFHWPYVIISYGDPLKYDRVIVNPTNTGDSDSFNYHLGKVETALGYGNQDPIAARLGGVLIKPVIPRPLFEQPKGIDQGSRAYTHALDRQSMKVDESSDLYRVDEQLIAMVDHALTELEAKGVKYKNDFLMQGYSASGNYITRFALLHSERVRAAVAGALNGMPMLPTESVNGVELTYPNGIADADELGIDIDLHAFKNTPLLYLQGELDDNDTLPFSDAFDDPQRREILEAFHPWFLDKYDNPMDFHNLYEGLDRQDMLERWNAHRQILSDLGYNNINAVTVPNAGHGVRSEYFDEILRFLESNM